jgi:hypothetical protein
MNTASRMKLTNFLTNNAPELIEIKYLLMDAEDFNTFEDVREIIEHAGGFDIEIIYYADAMDYLKEHDPSLSQCLELAENMGYRTGDLSSELLASILASDIVREQFNDLESDFNDLLEELTAAEEAEEGADA